MAATCNTPAKHSPSKSQCWLECEGLTQSGRTHERNVYTHVHTHIHTWRARPELHRCPGCCCMWVSAGRGLWWRWRWRWRGPGARFGGGVRSETRGRCTVTLGFQWDSDAQIGLWPPEQQQGWHVERLEGDADSTTTTWKKTLKNHENKIAKLVFWRTFGKFSHQNRAEVVTPIDNSDAAGLVVPTVTRLASRVASPWHHERERWHF